MHLKRTCLVFILLLAAALLATACTQSSPSPASSPASATVTRTPAAAAASTATPDRSEEGTATALAHVLASSEARMTEQVTYHTPTPTATYAPCRASPERFTLAWSEIETPDGARRQLALDLPAIKLEASPDGRWLIAVLQIRRTQSGPLTKTALIDPQRDRHIWLNQGDWGTIYHWLEDGRLVWYDETSCLYVGDPLEPRLLGRFEQTREMLVVGELAFLADYSVESPTIVDLETGDVGSLPGEPDIHVEPFGGYRVAVSNDEAYMLAFVADFSDDNLQSYRIYRFAPAMGAELQPMGSFGVQVAGTDSGRWLPLQQLGDSVYWFSSVYFWTGEPGSSLLTEGAIFDYRDGRIIGREQFPLPGDTFVLGYEPSPDGKWLAVMLADANASRDERYTLTAHYIASANNFAEGLVLEAAPSIPHQDLFDYRHADPHFYKWHPDNAVILPGAEGQVMVARLPLGRGASTLVESGTWVANLSGGRVLATAAESASRVLMYDLYGRLIEGLNLGGTYEAFPTAIRIGETIWLSAADQWVQGDYNYHCPCGLVVWEVE